MLSIPKPWGAHRPSLVPPAQASLGSAGSGAGPSWPGQCHAFGSVCSLRTQLCWPGVSISLETCQWLWHLSPGLTGPESLGGPRALCLDRRMWSCCCRDPHAQGPLHSGGSNPSGCRVQGLRTVVACTGRQACLTVSPSRSLRPGRSPHARSWPPRSGARDSAPSQGS